MSVRFDAWTRHAGIVALAVLAWAVFVPAGVLWTAAFAAGLVGSAVATAVLVRSRQAPSLAQVIAGATTEPVLVPARRGVTRGARRRSRGEGRP